MQPAKVLRRSTPIDTSRIKMSRSGIVESIPAMSLSPERESETFSPDVDGEFNNEKNIDSGIGNITETGRDHKTYNKRRQEVWTSQIDNHPRIISQGDLSYDLGDEIYALLPYCYFSGSDTICRRMVVVRGVISNLTWKSVNDLDIPREINGRLSPDNFDPSLSDLLFRPSIKSEKETIQTMFTSITIILNDSCLNIVNPKSSDQNPTMPYDYNLNISSMKPGSSKKAKKSRGSSRKSTEITIPYHYIIGKTFFVHRHLNTTDDQKIQHWIDKMRIGVQDGIEDLDSGLKLSVMDYFWNSRLELHFIVSCSTKPVRILNIRKLQAFDIRALYDHSNYYSFRVINLNNLRIHSMHSNDNYRSEILEILKSLFEKVSVYHVKKSLCGHLDVDSRVYEDSHGMSQIYSKHYGSVPEEGLRFTGITLTSYVKGLAYLEGHEPPDGVSFIFFHSRDYYEFDLDPESPTFLDFVDTGEKHNLFRNPDPGDIILANSFICEKGQYTGKTNLRWFFPSDDFRLLHLYVTRPSMRVSLIKTINANKKFDSPCLDFYNLIQHGFSSKNPTSNSPITNAFKNKHFWWLR